MGNRPIFVLLFGAAIMGLVSCGTTHQFFPTNPIPRKEWQLSINWHYDLDKQLRGMFVPEVSCYTGVGRNWNLGLGLQAPFFVSHLSTAKYYDIGSTHPWLGFVSANQIFGSNDNPYLELGLLRVDHQRTFDLQSGLGLAYGHGQTMPLPICTDQVVKNRLGFRYRLMPVLRFQISGRDLAFSYIHYHGKTASSIVRYKDSVQSRNDTLFVVDRLQADSLRLLDGHPWRRAWLCGLFLSSGDTILIAGKILYADNFIPRPPLFREGDVFWGKFGMRRAELFLRNGTSNQLADGQSAVVSLAALAERVNSRDRFAIMRFDPELNKLYSRCKSVVFDHSVAIGLNKRSDY